MPNDSENVPLLDTSDAEESASPRSGPNPLPWRQLSLVLSVAWCETLPSESIRPYINQRIGRLDIINGDIRKVGYYVGLMDSLMYICLAISVLQWNRLSDRIGRKPVLLMGLLGLMTSIICFGLARTYWVIVASRCLQGLLNGNYGVVKSTVGELTDATNRSRAFSLILVLFAASSIIGSPIGGFLVMPHDRFPKVFYGEFWSQFPYFLPCLIVSMILGTVFSIIALFLKETAPGKTAQPEVLQGVASPQRKPFPLQELVTRRPVIISVSNFVAMEFLGSAQEVLLPLFLAMPIEYGGLGFDSARIGLILGGSRALVAFLMVFFSGWIIHRIGERQLVIIGISSCLLIWIVFPIANLCARHFGIGICVWTGIALMVLPNFVMDMAHGCIFTFIMAASPNNHSLGATNGLAQTCNSTFRILSPVMASSLFSFSVQHNILGGYAVYLVFFILTIFIIMLACCLPHDVRPVWEREAQTPQM